MTSQWYGRSLAFVRTVKGWPPRYASANAAYEAAETVGRIHQGTPPPGAVVWLAGGVYGDCGIALGDDLLLVAGMHGPDVVSIRVRTVLGWSPGGFDDWPYDVDGAG